MKSLLQEAPSVERAISQAWEAAGRPVEFSVKIHDHGKRGFLGFSSSPAVVSITYKPLGAPAASGVVAKGRPANVRTGGQRDSEQPARSERRPLRDERSSSEKSDRSERTETGLLGGVLGERTERRGRNDRRADRSSSRSDRSGSRGDAPAPRGLLSYVSPEGDHEKKISQAKLAAAHKMCFAGLLL